MVAVLLLAVCVSAGGSRPIARYLPLHAYASHGSWPLHAGALDNGTVQIWEASGNFGRSAALEHVPVARAQQALFGVQTWKYAAASRHVIRAAQPPGREVTHLEILADGVTLLSRCDDDTLKVWDIRLLKLAVHVWELPISHTHTRMAVSPAQDLVLTGVAAEARRPCCLLSWAVTDRVLAAWRAHVQWGNRQEACGSMHGFPGSFACS